MQQLRQLNTDERELLARFVRLEITLDELLARLQDMLEFNFTPGWRTFRSYFILPEPGIRITLTDIDHAVAKRVTDEISTEELTRWATMILLNEAFEWQGPNEDEIGNRLNDLSMPQLFQGSKHAPGIV